jgi:hypothetical protein
MSETPICWSSVFISAFQPLMRFTIHLIDCWSESDLAWFGDILFVRTAGQ